MENPWRKHLAVNGGMDDVVLLQTGPDSFEVRVVGERPVQALLPRQTRDGLGRKIPPVVVATEIVRLLREHDAWPPPGHPGDAAEPVSLGRAVGRIPGFVDELRSRLG